MTTTIDLRVQYKIHTGEYPVWSQESLYRRGMERNIFSPNESKYGLNQDTHATFHGKPKSSYGLWLEEKIGVPKMLRHSYYKLFTDEAVYNNMTREKDEFLKAAYIDWLEKQLLNKLNKNA